MKKLFYTTLILCSVGIFSSCEKEEECVSNCGTIVNENACVADYCITIQNECTNNLETFIISYNDWIDAYTGNPFCITNVTSW